jgi:hypothetical protein
MKSSQKIARMTRKKKMTRNQTLKKSQKMISQTLNLQIWQVEDRLNMQVYLLTKDLTISYEEAWFTIQIVMIYLFMIWINS